MFDITESTEKNESEKKKITCHYCTKESFALQKIHYFVVKTPAFLFCTKNFHLFIRKKDPRISFTLRGFLFQKFFLLLKCVQNCDYVT